MYAVRGAGTLERKHAYTCGNYRNRARNDMLCTTHYIRKSVLKELVLADLQRVTSYVKEHEQEFIETANECSAKAVQKTLTQQRKELDKAQNRINELNILFRKLYEDNALGKLSDEQFAFLTSGYDEEKKDADPEDCGAVTGNRQRHRAQRGRKKVCRTGTQIHSD